MQQHKTGLRAKAYSYQGKSGILHTSEEKSAM